MSAVEAVPAASGIAANGAQSLAERVLAWSRVCPEAVAMISLGQAWTYRDLERASAEATALVQTLSPGEPLALVVNRAPETVALMLGGMRLGVPVLALSAQLPPEVRDRVAGDAGASTVRGADGTPVATVDRRELRTSAALMLTTSGSTGIPKVVCIPDSSLTAFADWAGESFELGPSSVSLSLAPMNFDLSLLEVWSVLAHGGTVVMASEQEAIRGRRLHDLLREHRPGLVQGVPLFHELLVQAAGGNRHESVRHLVLTGDVAEPALVSELRRVFPHAQVRNVYGATETNDSFEHLVADHEDPGEPLPIGRPLPGVCAMLVDPGGVELHGAAEGELWVSTPYLASGYTDDVRTRAAFAPRADPAGVRTFYRTGDIVSRDASGVHRFVGRHDRRIKVRGMQVDLDAVEVVLHQHPDVIEAAVRVDEAGAVRTVVAAVQVKARSAGSAQLADLDVALRLHCAGRLQPSAIPSRFAVTTRALARTSTGKLDRARAHIDITSEGELT